MNNTELLEQLEHDLLALAQLEQKFNTTELNLKREKAFASMSGAVDEFLAEHGVKRTEQAVKDALTVIFHQQNVELEELSARVAKAKIAVELSRLKAQFALRNKFAEQKDEESFDEF